MDSRWLLRLAALVGCVGLSAWLVSTHALEPEAGLHLKDLKVGESSLNDQGLYPGGNGGAGLAEEEDDLLKLLEESAEEEPTEEPAPAEEPESAPAEEPGMDELPAVEDPAAEPAEEAAEPAEDAGKAELPALKEPAPTPPPPPRKTAGGIGRPAPREVAPPGALPRRSAAPVREGDALADVALTESLRKDQARELVRMAQYLRERGELLAAESRLEQALQLEPMNEEAQLLLSDVRLLLGDTSGEVPGFAKWLKEEELVRQDQAVTEIRRLIREAAHYREAKDYDKAIERLERAVDGIRNFPFNLDLDQDLKQAESLLATVKEEKRAFDEEERQKFLKMVNDTRAAEAANDLRYVENQIRMLRRKAEIAENEGAFDRAITYYDRILTIQPNNDEIRERLGAVKERRHVTEMAALLQSSIDNYELAVVGIEESSVVYQQIFRYPEAQEWLRISPKVVSIEEEIGATESSLEKELRRKLEDKYEIGFEEGVALKDALSALQSISGVNFVLNKEGAEQADTTVTLPRFPDLPLKNVLNLILEAAGEDFTYAIREGAVVIGTKESLKQKTYLRFYEISDLIRVPPDFPAPPVALDELMSKDAGAAGLALDVSAEERPTGKLPKDILLDLLRKSLGEGAEGAEGISMMSGKLAARTTLENHLKLAALLDQFRASSGMMVTVESRFLDIQDNFLEEIGVDFGSANSTFLPNSIPDIDGAGTSIAPGYEYISPDGENNVRIASIGNLSQPIGTEVNPFNISSEGGGAFQLNVLKAERYQIEAILTGVAKEQEIRRLNSPRVTAFNGQVAHTLVVNQAAYIQDLEVNQTGVIPVINPVIDVLNSGAILEVRPTIGYDRKYVVLEIQPTLAEQLDSDVAILNLSGNFTVVPVELPVLSVTKIRTSVTVPDGGTVLVGGLKREISNKSQIGIPGFLDLPILNLISGRKGVSQLRSNLFVLINAKVTIVREEEARLFGT
jgi:tetratricopeptide (TPR) repeat protein